MNLHPLFVHFPIGILVLYAVVELGTYFFFRESVFLKQCKGLLVIVGAASAFVAMSFGEAAEKALDGSPVLLGHLVDTQLIEMHSTFAGATTLIFSLLAGAYLVWFVKNSRFGNAQFLQARFVAPLWRVLQTLGRFIRETWVAPLLALAGLSTLTITGGLGAAIVYGPEVDPFVRVVYHLFF